MNRKIFATLLTLGILLPPSMTNSAGAIPINNQLFQSSYSESQVGNDRLAQRPLKNFRDFRNLSREFSKQKSQLERFALRKARQFSRGERIRWDRAKVDLSVSSRPIVINLYGKIPLKVLKDKNAHLKVYFTLNRRRFEFQYEGFDLHISRCGGIRVACKRQKKNAENKLRQIFQQEAPEIECVINDKVKELLAGVAGTDRSTVRAQQDDGLSAANFEPRGYDSISQI